jgi:hypothetical protein
MQGALLAVDNAVSLELARAPIFLVLPKGVYDTRRLINNADAIYDGLPIRPPSDALSDTKEAGRCLAFELPTAAGFHIARATEAVVLMYMNEYQCPPPPDSARNWGRYHQILSNAQADEKILNHFEQLRKLHRNPLVHPEESLTRDDAESFWAMCGSLMRAMICDMDELRSGRKPLPAPIKPWPVPTTVVAVP